MKGFLVTLPLTHLEEDRVEPSGNQDGFQLRVWCQEETEEASLDVKHLGDR